LIKWLLNVTFDIFIDTNSTATTLATTTPTTISASITSFAGFATQHAVTKTKNILGALGSRTVAPSTAKMKTSLGRKTSKNKATTKLVTISNSMLCCKASK
jgi:pectate lyase